MNRNQLISLALTAVWVVPFQAHAQTAIAPETGLDSPDMVAQAAVEPRAAAQVGPLAARPGVEVYTSRHALTGGFGDWREVGVRGSYELGAHRLQAELASMRRYGETGNYLAIGDTVTLSPDWFASLSVGAGDGAFYLPKYRVDGFLNRKFLPERNLVGTLGAGYYRAPFGNTDRSMSIGATYYFSYPLVVQGEVRFNNSSPGSISTRQQFLAATLGRDKVTQVTARHAWGREGYQTIGQGMLLVDFRSNESSLKVRHWLGANWGLQAGVDRYRNPFYRRTGGNVGLFWQMS